jgi:hypothetical protein
MGQMRKLVKMLMAAKKKKKWKSFRKSLRRQARKR